MFNSNLLVYSQSQASCLLQRRPHHPLSNARRGSWNAVGSSAALGIWLRNHNRCTVDVGANIYTHLYLNLYLYLYQYLYLYIYVHNSTICIYIYIYILKICIIMVNDIVHMSLPWNFWPTMGMISRKWKPHPSKVRSQWTHCEKLTQMYEPIYVMWVQLVVLLVKIEGPVWYTIWIIW